MRRIAARAAGGASPPALGAWVGARAGSAWRAGPLGDVAALAARDALRAAVAMARWCLLFRTALAAGTVWRDETVRGAVAAAMRWRNAIMLIQGGVPGARWQTREQLASDLALYRRGGWPRCRHAGRCAGRRSRRRPSTCNSRRGPVRQQAAALRFGRRRARTKRWSICSARWTVAIRRVGQPQDAHKFTPHVTLARLRHPEAGQGAGMADA